ncbi:hypothetical protein [Pseudomonas frederiksbergensis]|uniref:hypothetical protein n=1 Tax=Pseudomonas frederiksbergensis TaxID=104087 RepID=UPI000AF5E9D4|nr:hypothetical protein [Pseudomonas frederiksbergensis]
MALFTCAKAANRRLAQSLQDTVQAHCDAVEWAAPSVNDDRLAEQVVGNIGGSGIDA